MKNIFATIILALLPIAASPQKVIYTSADSIRIEKILQRSTNNGNAGDIIIAIANEFIGEKYVGGVLERDTKEPLYISCTELDCTTFVELVLAIAKTADDGNYRFTDVCHNLETIRYRNGKNNGYSSRLHYISWWIKDNAKTGIIEDATPKISKERLLLNLNFMSSPPDRYPQLAENPDLVKEIEQREIPYRGIETHYIPTEKLGYNEINNIKAGDVIAITTSTPGLDVAHIGIAYYNNSTLCLIHASKKKGKVVKENIPLRDYLVNNKRHTGIMVFRAWC